MFMTIHFSLSLRNTFGSSKDRRLQADGSTSASNRFMHEDDTVFMWHFRFDVSLLIMDNWWQLMILGILGYHGYPYFRKPPLRINIGLIEFGIGLFLSEYGGFCSLPLSGCSVENFRVAGVAATTRQGHSHQGYWYNRKPWWNPKQWGYLKSRGARVYNRSDFVAFYSNPPKIVKSCKSIKLLLRWSLTVKNHVS